MNIRFLPPEESPRRITSDYVRKNHADMGLDAGIIELVCGLLDSGVVGTSYSCEGHFKIANGGHHNQKAQVRLEPKDYLSAFVLCHEIMRTVVVPEIEIALVIDQGRGDPSDGVYVDWVLEFRPVGFWDTRSGIKVANGWTEEKARKLLNEAFEGTIAICQRWGRGERPILDDRGWPPRSPKGPVRSSDHNKIAEWIQKT